MREEDEVSLATGRRGLVDMVAGVTSNRQPPKYATRGTGERTEIERKCVCELVTVTA